MRANAVGSKVSRSYIGIYQAALGRLGNSLRSATQLVENWTPQESPFGALSLVARTR